MDAAVPLDAKNAPTGTWKTAQNAVSHSTHTQHRVQKEEKQQNATLTTSTRLTHEIPDASDFARYCVMARASLMESQNHLIDVVDKGHITDTVRLEYNALAEAALEEVTGLMEYLQSPEALRNARRARERRIEKRAMREPRTRHIESNGEPNREPNQEPNREPNQEPNRAAEDEPRREHPEG